MSWSRRVFFITFVSPAGRDEAAAEERNIYFDTGERVRKLDVGFFYFDP